MKCEHLEKDAEIEYVDHHMYQAWCRECGARSFVFKNFSEVKDDPSQWHLPRREQER